MKLDEKLVSLRKKKGITQAELAETVQVSRQAVSKWESGGSLPSTENLRALSRLYGVPMDYLLNEEEAEEGEPFPQNPTVKPDTSENNRRKTGLKWCIAALVILMLIVFVGILIANKNKEYSHLGETQGEEVNGVPSIEFELEW
ncbi:helix-turn-helix domain-containing protein [uncultured Oscillibacter sp.]|uniref:helix-turn-helix domain-containing protein n=1 Tax=uncultured Oscillibacter sp. TaxID=876091 RepID=UPI0026109138|nr:helix-turn-helix transcriptional regulator [uncultured Oscillibacter sp.]